MNTSHSNNEGRLPSVDLSNPPGVLGDIARRILADAPIAKSGAAINAALALAGTALARKVQGETNLRTNVYLASLLDDQEGAYQVDNAVKRIALEVGMEDRIVGGPFTSKEALMRRVAEMPTALLHVGEIDRLIASALREGAPQRQMRLLLDLINLFSSADTVLYGTEFADQTRHPRIDIPYPCCSLHATAVSEDFYQAARELRRDQMRFIARFIVVEDLTIDDSDRSQTLATSDAIPRWFEKVNRLSPEGGGEIDPQSPILIGKSESASRRFADLTKDMDDRRDDEAAGKFGDLWSRGWELTEKIALICACADNPEHPHIEESHANWAIEFVWRNTDRLVSTLRGGQMNSVGPQQMHRRSIIRPGGAGMSAAPN